MKYILPAAVVLGVFAIPACADAPAPASAKIVVQASHGGSGHAGRIAAAGKRVPGGRATRAEIDLPLEWKNMLTDLRDRPAAVQDPLAYYRP